LQSFAFLSAPATRVVSSQDVFFFLCNSCKAPSSRTRPFPEKFLLDGGFSSKVFRFFSLFLALGTGESYSYRIPPIWPSFLLWFSFLLFSMFFFFPRFPSFFSRRHGFFVREKRFFFPPVSSLVEVIFSRVLFLRSLSTEPVSSDLSLFYVFLECFFFPWFWVFASSVAIFFLSLPPPLLLSSFLSQRVERSSLAVSPPFRGFFQTDFFFF